MSVAVTQVDTANDTFQIWVDTTNQMANVISTLAVTTNTHANGGLTTGNGYVEGIFGGRTLCANAVRGGTVETPGVLNLTTNVTINTSSRLVLGDIVINSSAVTANGEPIGGTVKFAANIDGTSATLVDSWDKTLKRATDYLLAVLDRNANAHHSARVMSLHNEGNVQIAEYAVLYSNASHGANGALGLWSANANSTHVRLYFTAGVANTRVTGTRLEVNI